MLERVKAERGQRPGILVAEHAEDAALLVQLVVVEGQRRQVIHAASSSDRRHQSPTPLFSIKLSRF